MNIQSNMLIAGSFLAAALLGAGCFSPAPQPSQPAAVATSTANIASSTPRILVPELGFSYVPYTTDTSVYGGAKLSGSRLMFGDNGKNFRSFDFIERVPPKDGEKFEARLQAFLKDSGGSLEKCRIEIASSTGALWGWLPEGLDVAFFEPKNRYIPTNNEVLDRLRATSHPKATNRELEKVCESSPECDFAKQDLVQEYNEKQCGLYAMDPHYQVVSMFIADPAKSPTILYMHTTGGGDRPVFDAGPIQFLP